VLVSSDGSSVAYDLLAVDVGSTTRHSERAGVAQHAIATRPIGLLCAKLDEFDRLAAAGSAEAASHGSRRHVVVVGAGAAGVELAMGLCAGRGRRVLLLLLVRRAKAPLLRAGCCLAPVTPCEHWFATRSSAWASLSWLAR
jgi:NADPH-dependent 2,4-dienoyl-CoA reductase/sulfur reductase-like enzyme